MRPNPALGPLKQRDNPSCYPLWSCIAGPAEVSFAGTFATGALWRCEPWQGEIPTLVELQPIPAFRIAWDKFSNLSNACRYRLWQCTAGPAEVSFAGTFAVGVWW